MCCLADGIWLQLAQPTAAPNPKLSRPLPDLHPEATANDDTTMASVKKENADSDLYGGKRSSNVPDMHSHGLSTDLYDDEFTVPLDDEYQSPVEPTQSSMLDKHPESTPTTTTSATNGKPEPSGTGTLPAKPATTEASGLSYSAQVAKQFSAYQQTPSQERQQRTTLSTNSQAGPSAIATHEGSADRSSQDRPIRPSEMKDEG